MIGAAVMMTRIPTGEVTDKPGDDEKDHSAKALGAKGGKARAEKLTAEQRAAIAKAGAENALAGKVGRYSSTVIPHFLIAARAQGEYEYDRRRSRHGRFDSL